VFAGRGKRLACASRAPRVRLACARASARQAGEGVSAHVAPLVPRALPSAWRLGGAGKGGRGRVRRPWQAPRVRLACASRAPRVRASECTPSRRGRAIERRRGWLARSPAAATRWRPRRWGCAVATTQVQYSRWRCSSPSSRASSRSSRPWSKVSALVAARSPTVRTRNLDFDRHSQCFR